MAQTHVQDGLPPDQLGYQVLGWHLLSMDGIVAVYVRSRGAFPLSQVLEDDMTMFVLLLESLKLVFRTEDWKSRVNTKKPAHESSPAVSVGR